MPLFVTVPPELMQLAQTLGFLLSSQPPTHPSDPASIRRAWADGASRVVCAASHAGILWDLRPLALFAATFGEPLRSGTFHAGLRSQGGLQASEWRTAQQGSLLFAHNPDEHPRTGGVFPAFEERTLAPSETLIWAHDFPLGLSENYLGAYAGLVKSDATLLTAHIRPDPHPGARLFVTGTPGEQRTVSVFNAGPGEVVEVVFGEAPAVFSVGVSQVIALPKPLASQLWILEEVTWLGPHWELTQTGEFIHHTEFKETVIGGDNEPVSARLVFEEPAPTSVWLNGVPLTGEDIVLLPGENRLLVHGPHGNAFVIPDGACFQVELVEWVSPPSTSASHL